MQKDSLETLLLRHYGHTAAAPIGLEEQLLASVRQKPAELLKEQRIAARLPARRVSRRYGFKLIARGTARAGLDVLSAGLDGLQRLEDVLAVQEVTQQAFS